MAQRAFITSHVKHFGETKNVGSLLKALALIVQQGRTVELMYGGYCALRHALPPCQPATTPCGLP